MHRPVLVSALAVLTIGLLSLVAGCSTDDLTDTAATPSLRTAEELVLPATLAGYVPTPPPDWRLVASPSTATLDEDGAQLVSITASYLPEDPSNATGDRSAEVTIQDTGGRATGLRKLVDSLSNASNEDNGLTRTSVQGHPAIVTSEGRVAGACVLVADRFVVYLAVSGGTQADIDAFITALDLEGLSSQR